MATPQNSHWAWQAAAALARRMRDRPGAMATLATGYGPSGAPHMGTVAEVLRTAMVAQAYRDITNNAPLRILSITDDMDGLRRAPLDDPNRLELEGYIGRPLCDIPDFSGCHTSYAARNVALLRGHLQHFEMTAVDPERSLQAVLDADPSAPDEVLCILSSDLYRGGHHDSMLRRVAGSASDIVRIVAPELGLERRRTWCPFVPLHDGVMVTDTHEWSAEDDVLAWQDADGSAHVTPVTGGACKLQWRVDWAMRWVGLGVDFEMHGKDLEDSVRLGHRIAPLLGGRAPVTLQYELFLDENGAKMSKSVGNGVAMGDWERHSPPAVFRHFLARDPRRARRIGTATIPEAVDLWLTDVRSAGTGTITPEVHLAHGDVKVPAIAMRLSFATLLAVVGLADTELPEVAIGLLSGYDPVGIDPQNATVTALVACAIQRHLQVGRPLRHYHVADDQQRVALLDLAAALEGFEDASTQEAIQAVIYEVGKRHGGPEGLREFFRLSYQVMLGQADGPRLGNLAAAVGPLYLASLLRERLDAN